MQKKAFDKIQHPFPIKTLRKLGIEGNFLNVINNICKKPTANTKLNDKKLKAFLVRSGTMRGCPSHYCFSTSHWKSQLL